MSQYATMQQVKDFGSMPSERIDQLEVLYPGITDRTVVIVSGMFDSRLKKRYAAPFQAPYPDSLIFNVCRVVAYRLWMKLGFDPSSPQDQAIIQDNTDALAWLKEAADSENGLVELPAIQASPLGAAAVDSGGPLSYSEAGPYQWIDVQWGRLVNGG